MKLKQIITFGVFAAALFLLGGCGAVRQETNPADELMQYLKNRYPEDSFTWVCNELRPSDASSGSFAICVKSAGFPDADLRAARWKNGDKMVYADNYMAYYLRSDVEAYMHDIAEEYFGECKVFMHVSSGKYTSEQFSTDATAEDYLRSKPDCSFSIYLPPDDLSAEKAKTALELFQADLYEKDFRKISGGVDMITDAEAYENCSSYDGPNGSIYDRNGLDFVGGFEVSDN